jgi:hypothetical protein
VAPDCGEKEAVVLCRHRSLIIAVAVLLVCLPTTVNGCGQATDVPSKTTTSGSAVDPGTPGTDQPLAAAPTSTSQANRYIYVSGTLDYMAGSIDEKITIDGSMTVSQNKGDEGNLIGNVEVTMRHHARGPIPGAGEGDLYWDGSDMSGVIRVTMPASTGKAPALLPFSAWSGGAGTITCTCKGTGYTVPAGDPKYMFKEMAFTISFSLLVTSGGITITVLDPGYSGTLTATTN